MSDKYTRKMLTEIRKKFDEINAVELPEKNMIVEQENIADKFVISEGADSVQEQPFVMSANDVQFGSVRAAQEESIKKTIGDVTLKPDALKYYPSIHDVVINGELTSIGAAFQFRYKDPSGDGCYIWVDGLQLTDENLKTIQKVRDAFLNWKQSLVEDGDLLDKLDKQANKKQ